MAPRPAPKRETRSTRDMILDAAERRFAERGFAGVAMREIATDAGLRNQASLYNHFRNKQALYEAVLARGLAPIVAVVSESGEAAESEVGQGAMRKDTIDAFLDRLLDYLEQHPHLPQLIQRAALDDVRHLRAAVPRLLRPIYAQGVHTLGQSDGPWQRTDLPLLAAGIYHLIFGYFASAKLLQVVGGGDPLSPGAVARQRRFVKKAVAELLGVGGRRRSGRS